MSSTLSSQKLKQIKGIVYTAKTPQEALEKAGISLKYAGEFNRVLFPLYKPQLEKSFKSALGRTLLYVSSFILSTLGLEPFEKHESELKELGTEAYEATRGMIFENPFFIGVSGAEKVKQELWKEFGRMINFVTQTVGPIGVYLFEAGSTYYIPYAVTSPMANILSKFPYVGKSEAEMERYKAIWTKWVTGENEYPIMAGFVESWWFGASKYSPVRKALEVAKQFGQLLQSL